MDQPVELTWHRSRDLLEGGESGDSVDGAPLAALRRMSASLVRGDWQAATVSCSRSQYEIAACCRRGVSALATSGRRRGRGHAGGDG